MHKPSSWVVSGKRKHNPSSRRQNRGVSSLWVDVLKVGGILDHVECALTSAQNVKVVTLSLLSAHVGRKLFMAYIRANA